MDKIIKKDIVNGVEYKYNWIGWGGSITENNVIYISQSDYDNLTPAEKADATKNYVIIGEGGIPVPTDINAEDVDFDNTWTGMTADNVQDAIEEVFQSVSNGKELLADAITDKGVSTSASDSFQTMATNISSLNVTDMTQDQTDRYNSSSWLVYFNWWNYWYRDGAYIITWEWLTVAYMITWSNRVSWVLLRWGVVKTFTTNPDMRWNYGTPKMYKDWTMIYILTSSSTTYDWCITIDRFNEIWSDYVHWELVSSQSIWVWSNNQWSLWWLTLTSYKYGNNYYNIYVTWTK